MKRGWILGIPALMLVGCDTGTTRIAGGSSEQGNAIQVVLVTSAGKPAAGARVVLHARSWVSGSTRDPLGQTLVADTAGRLTLTSKAGRRLLAGDSSGMAWADLDSLGDSATLHLLAPATVKGTVTDWSSGDHLAVPGTDLAASLGDSGRFSIAMPAYLGELSLVTTRKVVPLPVVTAAPGDTTTILPFAVGQADTAPVLAFSSQWLAIEPVLKGAQALRLGDTSFLRVTPGKWATLGAVIPDSTAQGTVSFSFRPGSQFDRDSAWSLLGDQGGRLHIGFLKGIVFFQKNTLSIHRFATSDTGQLGENRWYRISASWGPLGMILSVDGVPVAWNADTTFYKRDVSVDTAYLFSVGHKGACCMEALRITRSMQGAGDYSSIQFLKTQTDPWGDGVAHACPDSTSASLLPRCGSEATPTVTDPLW